MEVEAINEELWKHGEVNAGSCALRFRSCIIWLCNFLVFVSFGFRRRLIIKYNIIYTKARACSNSL